MILKVTLAQWQLELWDFISVSVVKHDLQEREKKKEENGKVYIGHIRRKSEES